MLIERKQHVWKGYRIMINNIMNGLYTVARSSSLYYVILEQGEPAFLYCSDDDTGVKMMNE